MKKEEQESLDPQNWDEMRTLGYRMMDDAIDYLSSIRERPVWKETPDDIRVKFRENAPEGPQDAAEVYDEFKQDIMPYVMGNTHPRFWAWYMGNGTILGAMADFLTSVVTPNAGAGNHIGQFLEEQVISWMLEIVQYPKTGSGILVSGGSMANYVGITVARHVKAGYDVRAQGILEGGTQFTVYASTEVHSCNQKAVELLGIGAKYLRKIPTNEDYTIDIALLQEKITDDRKLGYVPLCIIGSAGTVNTGAVDDLEALSVISKKENMWFHVDGAIGAIAMLSPKVRPSLKGIELSDSVALDLHKWMHVPFEAGCVLVKSRSGHQDAFQLIPEYLQQNKKGLASGKDWFSNYGIQLSRRMRSLKVWMTLKEHGKAKLGRMISRNVDQANYLAEIVRSTSELELMASVGMDIVCFRYIDPSMDLDATNKLNQSILIQLHEKGWAVPSYTTLNGKYCIRVAIANHRSRLEDFAFLVEKVLEVGEELKSDK
jgi:aromatic-L-amino-acid decarboxylase